ncbi:ABC transporter permease [Macrococcus armenti]|uniref:ABC transporter permease n=1 Tax=Macrococcus armenti TaxID=2875764 RepID=UPI001CCC5927|nr:ABC transporter permease [Macrococcus armenti]UBH15091.1 ABC transporter permease [Macrococcus armenti]UBH17452.1 ABC transporter permease [Macrococcus armenti]UBH19716.1 ABC transporter permease [Macrococcus armenti]
MINYMRSEAYKLLRTKGIYITYTICISLLILAALTLYYFGHRGDYFPYYRADFYYNNVFGFWLLIAMIGAMINSFLTNKESKRVAKQSISFGIHRKTIFFGKYLVSLIAYTILCIIGLIVMLICGQLLLPEDSRAVQEFLLSLINFSPIILGAFSLAHAINIMMYKESVAVTVTVFILLGSSTIMYILSNMNKAFEILYNHTPQVLSERVLTEFMKHQVTLSADFWISSIIITSLSLWIGYSRFNKEDF